MIADQGGVSPSGFSYHSSDWAPVCLPIRGSYDDYGGIEYYEVTALHNLALDEIKESWVDPKVDGIHIHEASLRENLTWHSMLDCVERDGAALHYTAWRRDKRHAALGMFMIHEAVYQALSADGLAREGWDGPTYGEEMDTILAGADQMEYMPQDPFRNLGLGSWRSMRLPSLVKAANADEDPEALLSEIKTFAGFDVAMAFLRKSYRPQPGKGSQCDESAMHRTLFKVCDGIFQEREEREERERRDQ